MPGFSSPKRRAYQILTGSSVVNQVLPLRRRMPVMVAH